MSARRTIRPLAVIDDPTESTRLLPISKAHYFWRAKTNSSRIGLLRASPWQMMPFPKRFSSFPILVWTRGPIPGCETSLEQVRSLFTLSSFSRIIIYMEVRVAVSPARSRPQPHEAESERDRTLKEAVRHLRWNFCLLKPVKSPGEKARGRGGGERV